MEPGEVIKRFGMLRTFELVGFCQLWRSMGRPCLRKLQTEVRMELERQGLSTSAAYRYIRELKRWNEELGREPDQVDDLAGLVAAIFDVEEEELPQTASPARLKQARA